MEKFFFWLKDHQRDVAIFVFFFLISVLSFGIGYLVAKEETHAPIIIQKTGAEKGP